MFENKDSESEIIQKVAQFEDMVNGESFTFLMWRILRKLLIII